MEITKISASLYDVSMGFVHAYLIDNGGEWALVDTGIEGKGKELLETMEEAGLKGSLGHIILTQLHGDHTGSLRELYDLTGAAVYAHEEEADAIEQGLTMRACVAAPGLLKGLMNRFVIRGGKPTYLKEGTPVNVKLKGGETLPLGPGVEIIHTPGHTAGHICLILKEEGGVLIAGDAASGGKEPGYPMLFEDREKGMSTLRQMGLLLFDKAVFGHGSPIMERASEKFRKAFS